jgi:integrase
LLSGVSSNIVYDTFRHLAAPAALPRSYPIGKLLTAVAIAKARAGAERREIPDGGCSGLYLIVQPSGVKSWAARYRTHDRKTVKFTLGPVLIGAGAESDHPPEVGAPLGLAAARELCTRVLREVQAGRDPAAVKRQQRAQEKAAAGGTFESVAEQFLRLKAPSPKGPGLRTLGQRRSDLGLLYKPLGQSPIDLIKRSAFVAQFDRIEEARGATRANRVQNAVKALLNWYSARSDDYVSVLTRTPARISIAARARSHVPTDAELQAIVLAAEQDKLFGSYLLLTLLTAARRGESGGLRRSELSPDGRTWIIPGFRYKNGRDTLIPLSAKAQAIIASMPVLPRGDHVFSADGAFALDNFAARKARFDALCGVRGWVIHDLRRAARTLLSRAGVNVDVAEQCLGHSLRGVRAVYDRHAFESEKRDAFEALARMVEDIARPPCATVVAFRRSKPARRK